MRKYSNLILSLISLTVTSTLLVVLIMAWYVSNTKVDATGLKAGTAEDTYVFNFYYWEETTDENDNRSGSWKLTKNDLSIQDAMPGDIFYFKVEGTGLTVDEVVQMIFRDVSSELDTDTVKGVYNPLTEQYEVRFNDVKRYSSATSEIDVSYVIDDTSEEKTLYNLLTENNDNNKYIKTTDLTFVSGKDYYTLSNGTYSKATVTVGAAVSSNTYYELMQGYDVTLDEILVEDVFKIYNNISLTTLGNISDAPNGKGNSYVSITSQFVNYTVTEQDNGEKNFYFALSFDSTGVSATDNYYQYQKLNLSNINITA